jgi:hypothetical protein
MPLLVAQPDTSQIYIFNNEGNNIAVPDSANQQLSPGYNIKNGFQGGAQTDIFTSTPAWNAWSGTWTCECSLMNLIHPHRTEPATDQQQSVKRDLEGRPRVPLRFSKA